MKFTQLIQAGAILAALVALSSAAGAQQLLRANERYCLEESGRRGGSMLCRFETMEQCFASKISPGNRCYLNPWIAFGQAKVIGG
jgi:hypothetical protein